MDMEILITIFIAVGFALFAYLPNEQRPEHTGDDKNDDNETK
jgi:hypothetical protein